MDGIGNGVIFSDRVMEKLVDSNRNKRLDATEIMKFWRMAMDRAVDYAQADAGSRDRKFADSLGQLTPQLLRTELLRMRAEAGQYFPNGIEMPSDAQIREMVALGQEAQRRIVDFRVRGGVLDRVQGTLAVIGNELEWNSMLIGAAAETLFEDSGLGNLNPPGSGNRSPRVRN